MKNSRSVSAVSWSVLGRYLPSLIQIVSTLYIARLITPEAFGEIAIITTFTQIANLLIASGFHEALVYRVNNSQTLYSTVFYINFLVAILLYVLLWIFSNDIADFYSIERLGVLTKVISLNIIIYSFSYIQRVIYAIKLDFKTPALIVFMSSVLGSCLGIYLAFHNYEVWAVVFQTLSINFIQVVLFWTVSSWRPSILFSIKEIKQILPYTMKILVNNITETLYENIYSLVIGKVYSSKILGYYNRTQTLVYYTTTNFMYSIESVFYPLLCKRKEDKQHLAESHQILLRLTTLISFPVLIILLALGKEIIILILTEKWIGAVSILKLLALAYLFMPIIYVNNSFLKIHNKPSILLYTTIIKKIIGISILFFSIQYDIIIVCYGMIAYYLFDAIVSIVSIHFITDIKIINQVKSIIFNLLANVSLYFVLTFTASYIPNNFLKIIISIAIGLIYYVSIFVLFRTKEFYLVKKILGHK